jgi:hypothetical protein
MKIDVLDRQAPRPAGLSRALRLRDRRRIPHRP